MRFIKVLLLVLIFFFFTIFVIQNHAVLGQSLSFRLDFFVLPVYESIPLPMYFIVLIAFLTGGLVCLLILLGDRIKVAFALHKARKRVNVLEQEVTLLRALPLKEGSLKKELVSELAPQGLSVGVKPALGSPAEKDKPLGEKAAETVLEEGANPETKAADSSVKNESENKNDSVGKS